MRGEEVGGGEMRWEEGRGGERRTYISATSSDQFQRPHGCIQRL
jgi:hypothetical protein